MEELREDLRELTDAATVLLDDRLYTFESYRALVQAVAYAKVALANDAAEEETLRGAYTGLCEAVDGMELRETRPSEDKRTDKKRPEGLQKALPYLLGGAALGGLVLGKKLFGKKKKDKNAKKEKKEEAKGT